MSDDVIRFECPDCNKRFRAKASMGGKEIECSSCGAMLIVPRATPEPEVEEQPKRRPKPKIQPETASVIDQIKVQGKQFSNSISGNSPKSFADLVDIFDFRFKRYLTPYIIRLIWILAVAGCLFFVLGNTLITPFMGTETNNVRMQRSDDGIGRNAPEKNIKPSKLAKAFIEIIAWLVSNVLVVIGALFILLVLRLIFEQIILLFNISNDLKRLVESIEKNRE